ncbi:hypothetical protein J2T60_002351 [Natronospira proteinivora]|uniref:Uncharacterized protein n=1 Tax=Natronospira proteinivora TaxID=1807133 RepID=A0ABT1GAJ6_9GAMM|nr:hypothetical protein [Natronospira proteinivora]MCP1728351.1 hypothetical protein [Natronospira proteinivora]
MRKLVYGLIAVLVAAGASYYYQVHQINRAVDDIGRQLAPFGRLEHGGASFSLSGEARINRLRFFPHESHEDIAVRRAAIRTGGLFNLMQINQTLQEGRLPSELGVSLRGARLPFDSFMFESMEEGGLGMGLPFEAAGCGDRLVFSSRDMTRMGFFTFTGFIDMGYETTGNIDAINWSLDAVAEGISRTYFSASMEMDAHSDHLQDLYMAATSMYIGSVNMEYEDLGYYERVMEFCADEMDMPLDEYIDHHVEQWQLRWLEEGLVAGPDMVAAYREFLDDPGMLSAQIIPTGDVFSLFAQGVSLSRLLRNLNISVSIEGQDLGRLDLRTASREEQEALTGARRSWTRSDDGDSASTEDDETGQLVQPGWKTVSIDDIAQHRDASVRITLQDGREREGRLKEVEGGQLIIERRMRGGYMEVPVRHSDIEDIQVWY